MSGSGYPIIDEQMLSRRTALGRPPAPRPGVAVVIHQVGHDLVVLTESKQRAERWSAFRGPMQVYWVDLSPRALRFRLEVPAAGDAFHFTAVVQVSCRVKDPRVVVKDRIQDAYQAVEPVVAGAVNSISRAHTLEQSKEAESKCRQAIEGLLHQPIVGGAFELENGGVVLSVDPGARDKMRETGLLRLEGETRKEATEQELQRLTARFDHFLPMIPEGDRQLLAAMVANDSAALPRVLDMIREDRATSAEQVVQILRELLAREKLDEFDLQPVTRWVLERLPQLDRPALGPAEPPPDVITGEAETVEPPPSGRLKRKTRS